MGGCRYCSACREHRKRSTRARRATVPSTDQGSTNAIRQRVLKRDKQKCRACGDRTYNVAYLVPLSQDGAYTDENLMAACKACHNVAPHLAFPSIEYKVAHIRQSRMRP